MCVKVVRNPETPTRLNAAFSFRPPDPPAGGCRRKIAGPPRNPSARYVASMATLRDVAGIGPDPQYRARRNKKCISAGRPPAAASRFVLFLCCRNPRHRYVTAAFRPAKQNSSRPPHVLSITPRMSSESGGGGRSTVSKGNGPSLRHLGLVGSPCVLARSSKQQANTMWWATNVIPMTSIFYIYVGISTGAPRIRPQLVAGTNPEGRRAWDISAEGGRPLSILKRPARFIRLSAAVCWRLTRN